MNRRTFLASVAGSTALGATSDATAQTTAQRDAKAPASRVVKMKTEGSSYLFDPIGLFVNPGETVTWEIASGSHSTTSYTANNPQYDGPRLIPKGAEPWNSGVVSGGKTFEYTFEEEGTYTYFCIPHKSLGMVGRVVCGSPGGPGETKAMPESDKPSAGIMPPSDEIVKQKRIEFPYVPNEPHGGPPLVFWGGLGAFSLTSVYLFAVYDERTSRYEDRPEDELNNRE